MNETNFGEFPARNFVETVETTAVTDRPFLSTPIDSFSVTEGLLLILVLLAVFGFLWKLVREVF